MSVLMTTPALTRRRPARRLALGLLLAALLAPLFVVAAAFTTATAPSADAAALSQVKARGERVVAVARSRAGSPYVYGAEGPRAFDCSGLTQWVYRKIGKHLPRTSSQQAGAVRRIAKRDRVRGDLVFFRSGGRVYHVAIYAGDGRIWHAPRPGTQVRKEKIWTGAVTYGRVR